MTSPSFFDPGTPPPPIEPDETDIGSPPPSRPSGAPIHDPREMARRSNKRKSLLIGGGGFLVVVVVAALLAKRGGGKAPTPVATPGSGVATADTGAVTVGRPGNTGLGIDTVGMDGIQAGSNPTERDDLGIPSDLASDPTPGTPGGSGALGAPNLPPATLPNQTPTGTVPTATPTTTPATTPVPAPSTEAPQTTPTPRSAPIDLTGGGLLGSLEPANKPVTTMPEAPDPAEVSERKRLAALRADSLAQVAAAARTARLAKLRGQKITMLSASSGLGGAADDLLGGGSTPAPNARPDAVYVPVDAAAPAVLLTEFDSGNQGGGRVLAQLTAPLRVQGRILLPAGTRAQGTASARIGERGTPTIVTISFTSFVLPNGELAKGFAAEAGDPRSLSAGLSDVSVNRHYPAQIFGATMASAYELLVGSLSKNRPNSFEQPSVFDQSVANVRDRGTRIIGGEFQEGRWTPTVKLRQGTAMTLLFGFRGGEVTPAVPPGTPTGTP